jgi:hypothetical protein
MTKIFATAIAAATLLAASLAATRGHAQDSKMNRQDLGLAQGFETQISWDRDDGDHRRRSNSGATVVIGPGSVTCVTFGPRRRENCCMVTTTSEQPIAEPGFLAAATTNVDRSRKGDRLTVKDGVGQ